MDAATATLSVPACLAGHRLAIALCAAAAVALAPCSYALPTPPAEAGANLALIQLTPTGEFRPSDGREMKVKSWRIDGEIAARVIERFNARKNPAVIDYEHQTQLAETNGQPAPAAGWIRSLQWQEGSGLWAVVEFTARASKHISDGEYRYVSPVFFYDVDTGEVLAILMAAITNSPAIDGMAALEARAAATFSFHPDTGSQESPSMNKLHLALCALLGLNANQTSEDQAVAACNALKPKLDALEKIRHEVGAEEITDDRSATAAVTATASLKSRAASQGAEPDPAKYVPVAVVEAVKGDLAALRSELTGRDVEQLVEDGLKDGRLLDAQKDWATDLGKKDIAALKGYLASAQPIAALRATQTGGHRPSGGNDENGLNQDELAVCRATGVDPKAFAEAKKGQAVA